MKYVIVGLGNPGPEYENTRHNTGRIIAGAFAEEIGASEFSADKKIKAEVAKGKLGKHEVVIVKPDTFMNKSGEAVKKFVASKKAAETLVVIHDDLDIPFGRMKLSFNKSAGGHRGVLSVIKAVKTEAFLRLRVGISPATASGKIRKPEGEKAVEALILGKFKPAELLALKKLAKLAVRGLETLITEGKDKATGEINSIS